VIKYKVLLSLLQGYNGGVCVQWQRQRCSGGMAEAVVEVVEELVGRRS